MLSCLPYFTILLPTCSVQNHPFSYPIFSYHNWCQENLYYSERFFSVNFFQKYKTEIEIGHLFLSIFKILKKVLRIFFSKMTSDHYALIFKQGSRKIYEIRKCGVIGNVKMLAYIKEKMYQNTSQHKEKFHCATCRFTCSKKGDYNRHINSVKHKNANKESKNAIQDTSPNENKFHCATCRFTCSKKGDYNRHINCIKHKNANKESKTNIQNTSHIICSYCGAKFSHRASLCRHKKTCKSTSCISHEKQTDKQVDNNATISQIDDIMEHMQKSQLEMMNMMFEQFKKIMPLVAKKSQSKYYCDVCDYKCSRPSDLVKHEMTRKHKRAKSLLNFDTEWSCKCGKSFKHQSSLSRHKHFCLYSASSYQNPKICGTSDQTDIINVDEDNVIDGI